MMNCRFREAGAVVLTARHSTRWLWIPVLAWACVTGISAQTSATGAAARQWRTRHERAIIDEFTAFLSLPNITSDRDGIARNAAALGEMMRTRGITPQVLSVPGANPVVFGEIRTPGATSTIVLCAHYDGQPVEPRDWATPPFSPVIRAHAPDNRRPVIPFPPQGQALDPEARIYARPASDDKAEIVALLTAVDAIKAAPAPSLQHQVCVRGRRRGGITESPSSNGRWARR